MIHLYQFPISHYCEKVRWVLDYKNLPYQVHNLIPGPHVLTIKRLAKNTTVPVLVDGNKIIQDSTHIINYLDAQYPKKPLGFSDEKLNQEALELDEYFDREVGLHLRRYFYYYLLEDAVLVKEMLLQQTPAWGKALYVLIFPVVKQLMKKGMRINKAGAAKSKQKLEIALERLNKLIENARPSGSKKAQKFLVGERLSRADITAASLLAPLCQPLEHDFDWGDFHRMPTPLKEFRKKHQFEPFVDWVMGLYQTRKVHS